MEAYIIIGQGAAGKSSLVRALTGVRNAEERLMARAAGGTFRLWARDSSLQEARISPSAFIAEVTGRAVDAALCTLWPRRCRSKGVVYPDANGYISAFQTAGWLVKNAVIVYGGGPPVVVPLPPGGGAASFVNARTVPFNTTAAAVRAHWGWV